MMIISSWLGNVVGRLGRTTSSRKRRRAQNVVSAIIETCEPRQLLAAALVKDIKPGTEGAFPPVVNVLGAGSSKVFFAVDDGSGKGVELYGSDGTSAGTSLVKDILPGAESSSRPTGSTQTKTGLSDFATVGTTTYFAANDGTAGSELWKTDGTAAGTVLVKDINAGAGHSEPTKFVPFGADKVLFYAKTDASGYELWISDGTTTGTTQVKEIRTGTANGVDPDESPLPVVIGTTAYFTANEGTTGFELWKTDGTDAGTSLVKDVNPGTAGLSDPQFAPEMKAVGTTLYFVARTAANGVELWKSDGTTAGTTIVKDLYTGQDPNNAANPASSSPTALTAFGTKLVFTATTAAEGTELWITDGSDAGTTLIKDIFPGTTSGAGNSSRAQALGVLGTTLLFAANDGVAGSELWKTDGTAGGTSMLFDVNPGAADGINASDGAVVFDGKVFFQGETVANGRELWRSDGTVAGTALDTDVSPGVAKPSNIASLTVAGGRLYFIADDGTTGLELWSRGTGGVSPNSAPALDNSGTPYYVAGVGQRLTANLTNGILVLDMLARGAGGNPITDADGGAAKGIAVTAIDKTFGKWQYTTKADPVDADWTDIDTGSAVSATSALLLKADAATRIRMVSTLKPHHEGTVAQGFLPIESKLDAGITFRAWDQTSGTAGQRGDTTTNGGTTAFSTATETMLTFFEARLWRSFNKNASLNVYTLEAEFFALTANPAYEDRANDNYTGFTVYLSPLTAAVPTAGLLRMYYGVQFNEEGTETDMGYRYLTTNVGEATTLEGLGRADKRAQRAGAYFREIGVNNGTAITGYIATAAQPGTMEMFQTYRLDPVDKPTRPGGTAEGSRANSNKKQEIGDHVYTVNVNAENSSAGTWRKEASRGFVRELSPNTLIVSSAAFEAGATIPAKFSKDGGNVSPALSWSNIPAGVQSFVLSVIDESVPNGFSHWIAWNIPAGSTSLAEGIAKQIALADGTKQGKNGFDATGYDGPQPPTGPAHRYTFSIAALNTTLNLPDNSDSAALKAAVSGKIVAAGRTGGYFTKP